MQIRKENSTNNLCVVCEMQEDWDYTHERVCVLFIGTRFSNLYTEKELMRCAQDLVQLKKCMFLRDEEFEKARDLMVEHPDVTWQGG